MTNVEVAERAFELVRQGRPHAVFEERLAAAEAEWRPAFATPGPGVYVGEQGFEDFLTMWTGDFQDWSIELDRMVDGGDCVVGFARQTAVGRRSGLPGEQDFALLFVLADGRITCVRVYLDGHDALAAAGLEDSVVS